MSLVAFDFDGTLSESEMTVLLGATRGVADEMAAITERAMNDELGYAESLRERVALLEGLALGEAEAALAETRLRPGAGELLGDLRAAGHDVAILTGGFERGVDAALAAAGTEVDAVVANRLVAADGALTGAVEGNLVEGTKDEALAALAEERGHDVAATVAVGDGANDLPMLEAAGLAVGFEPRPAVPSACEEVVADVGGLRRVFEREGLL
jgi:phosphoserine phosphatase